MKDFNFPSGYDYSTENLNDADVIDSRKDKRIDARKRRRFFRVNAVIMVILLLVGAFVGTLYLWLRSPHYVTVGYPFEYAFFNNNFELLDKSVNYYGIDINIPIFDFERNSYYPAIVIAVRQNNYEMVHALYALGADVNVQFGTAATTPLHLAAEVGTSRMVEYLIQRGADIDARNRDSKTPLHFAVNNHRTQVLALLLYNNENPNPQCQLGWTPLHRAAQAGHTYAVSMLINAGAYTNAKTSDGWTPLELAENAGNIEIVELLSE